MSRTPREFRDAPDAFRCEATITLKDKTTARCGKWNKPGERLCTQHFKIAKRGGSSVSMKSGDEQAERANIPQSGAAPSVNAALAVEGAAVGASSPKPSSAATLATLTAGGAHSIGCCCEDCSLARVRDGHESGEVR